jgi:hypothetical protein
LFVNADIETFVELERDETGERAPQSSYGSTSGAQRRGQVVIPTNTVTTKDGLTVRARIDPSLVSYLPRSDAFSLPPANAFRYPFTVLYNHGSSCSRSLRL